MCAVRARALPSAIACSLIFRISSTLPTYRGVTLLDRPAALRPRAGKDKLVWRLPLSSSTGKCHRCSVCASPSAHRADTEYSSTKRDGHVPPVPVTARTDRVRVTPSPHPGMGCLSFQETVTIVFSHTTPRVCRCSHLERCLPPARTNSSMERKTECAQCKRCNGNERALRLEAGIGKHSSSALLSQGSAPLTCPLKSSTAQSMNFWRPDTTY